MSAAFCYVCYSNEVSVRDGVLVCEVCGTQAQVAIEEQEFQQGIDDAKGKKKIRATTTQATVAATANAEIQERRAKEDLRAAAATYCAALQRLLRAQAKALVELHGANPQVESVMRQIWLALLPTTGILEPDYYRRTPRQSSTADGGGEGGRAPTGQAAEAPPAAAAGPQPAGDLSAAAAAQASRPQRLRRALWRLLSPQATLRVCFLACHLMREAVMPADVITWAASGQLPYFELPAFAAEAAEAAAARPAAAGGGAAAVPAPLPAACVTPQIWDTPARLAAGARGIASQLGLQLPPVNGEALLMRMALELGLPPGVADCARQLLRVHLAGRPALAPANGKAAAAERASPYTSVSATLLVAIKLIYGVGSPSADSGGGGGGGGGVDGSSGLGGGGEEGRGGALPGAPPPPASWPEWAAGALRRLRLARGGIPGSAAEAAALQGAQADRYLDFCIRALFAQQSQHQPGAAAGGGAGAGAGSGAGGEGELWEFRRLFLGMWEVAAAADQEEGELAEAAAGGGEEGGGGGGSGGPGRRPPSGRGAAAASGGGLENGSGSGGGGGGGGPAGYALADGLGRVHPDYAALLAACAACARVAPAALHRAVVRVEALVVDAESAVLMSEQAAE